MKKEFKVLTEATVVTLSGFCKGYTANGYLAVIENELCFVRKINDHSLFDDDIQTVWDIIDHFCFCEVKEERYDYYDANNCKIDIAELRKSIG